MPKAHYVMIGGFLGAGKTTAVLKLAEHLSRRGRRVGLITNDQSYGLVDTAMLSAHGFDVEEITGGCFCCRFNSLMEAAERLSRETRPDVFIAEPVGSCTDLKAAVSYPLRRMYGDEYRVAPLSVMVDPIRALRILGLEAGKAFSPKVRYVYAKQLEEAEVIVINKCDLLSADRLEMLRGALRERFPRARLFSVSAREAIGLEPWFDVIASDEAGSAPAPDLDYELYAEGEALLGWLNCTAWVSGRGPFDGNRLLRELAVAIQTALAVADLEIAHLKMTLNPDEDGNDIAVLNLVRNDGLPEMSHSLQELLGSGELIINLRAEGDPEALKTATLAAIRRSGEQSGGLSVTIQHMEHFRPAKPSPTYRLVVA